jgi:hypothetical protein
LLLRSCKSEIIVLASPSTSYICHDIVLESD